MESEGRTSYTTKVFDEMSKTIKQFSVLNVKILLWITNLAHDLRTYVCLKNYVNKPYQKYIITYIIYMLFIEWALVFKRVFELT